jgi:hypothetical protein
MRFFVLAIVLMSCVDADPGPAIVSGAIKKDIPMSINRQIDVLFVIDNSPGMAQYATGLAPNFHRFVDTLRSTPTGMPDLHVGVVTTDLGGANCTTNDEARFRTVAGMFNTFLADSISQDATRLRNYTGELGDIFVRLADVGTAGCAETQPLAAARRAFEHAAGFVRDDSFVVIFIISSRDAPDDASTIESYERFFKSLRTDPSKVMVGAVLGDTSPTSRLAQFLDRFPNRSTRASLASADWSTVFQNLGLLIKTSLGSPCIEGPLLDISPAPGDQLACEVWYELPAFSKKVPSCDSTSLGPCWQIVENEQYCPSFGDLHLRLFEIVRPMVDLPNETHLSIECLSR